MFDRKNQSDAELDFSVSAGCKNNTFYSRSAQAALFRYGGKANPPPRLPPAVRRVPPRSRLPSPVPVAISDSLCRGVMSRAGVG